MINRLIVAGLVLTCIQSLRLRADVPGKISNPVGPREAAPAQTAPVGPPHAPGTVPGVQKRDAAAEPRLIDLTDYYTLGLDEDASGVYGYTLGALPKGIHQLDNERYDLRGIVQLSCQQFVFGRKLFPQFVKGIKVAQKCQKLVFLHASRWTEDQGTKIGAYVVHFADRQTREIPIRFGIDLRDWKPQHDSEVRGKGPTVGWKGQDKAGSEVVLFEATWTNPLPETEITAINMTSTMTNAGPFLVAVTAK
jgi:hypothetical protein